MTAIRDRYYQSSDLINGTQRHIEIKLLARGYIAGVWCNQNLTPSSLMLKLTFITTRL